MDRGKKVIEGLGDFIRLMDEFTGRLKSSEAVGLSLIPNKAPEASLVVGCSK
jgi:hypothetical protein